MLGLKHGGGRGRRGGDLIVETTIASFTVTQLIMSFLFIFALVLVEIRTCISPQNLHFGPFRLYSWPLNLDITCSILGESSYPRDQLPQIGRARVGKECFD